MSESRSMYMQNQNIYSLESLPSSFLICLKTLTQSSQENNLNWPYDYIYNLLSSLAVSDIHLY